MTLRLELDVLQCPRCFAPMVRNTEDSIFCHSGHTFPISEGILSLLPPLSPDDPRAEEEKEFADSSPQAERTRRAPWLWITRFPSVRRFETELVACFGPGRFLELGGGSCYAAAIVKSTYPEAVVYASDVAINTLRNLARPVCRLFPKQPDYYVAAAAETLPFRDCTIDYVFGQLFLHHSPLPSQVLREAHRVLRPGGRLVFLEPAVPRHFRWLFKNQAENREISLQIKEDLLSTSDWERIVNLSGLPAPALKVSTNSEYQTNPWFVIAGRILSRLPQRMVKRLFPTGAIIDYRKPLSTA